MILSKEELQKGFAVAHDEHKGEQSEEQIMGLLMKCKDDDGEEALIVSFSRSLNYGKGVHAKRKAGKMRGNGRVDLWRNVLMMGRQGVCGVLYD